MQKSRIILLFFLAFLATNFVYAQSYPSDQSTPSPSTNDTSGPTPNAADQTAPNTTDQTPSTPEPAATTPDQTTTTSTTTETTTQTLSSTQISKTLCDTKMAMRKLWEDHIVFTRNYIISALANLQDINAVTQRLLKNQDDIGDAIKPFYGDDAGNKLTALLRAHIQIASEVVKAAKAHNNAALSKSQKKWTDNANQIAAFLSGANPNWSQSDLLEALQKHLDLTSGEVISRLKKNWNDDIKFYDENQDHMLLFSDFLVDGIATQFPDKF